MMRKGNQDLRRVGWIRCHIIIDLEEKLHWGLER